jgi:DNA repair protein RecO (recombination protein O)
MVVKDQIIVLKTIDFKDTSKIVGVLSKEYGRISLIAKGAKNPKSKFSGVLQAGNILEALYYYKSGRDIHTLSDASFLIKAYPIHFDMEKLSILLPTLEMIEQLVSEQSHTVDFFTFTEGLISWLVQESQPVKTLFPYILVRLAELSGIQLNFENEQFEPEKDYYLNGELGLICTEVSSGLSIKLQPRQAHYLFLACSNRGKSVQNYSMDKFELKNLIHHIDVYFKLHIDDIFDRKSDEIFDDISD